jgi:hypothetical protein
MSKRTEQELRDSIRIERVTSSYSLEGRSPAGIKTSSFLSYTAKCEDDEGWTMEEARYTESCLAQKVVEDLYTDAFIRQQITKNNRQAQVQKLTPMYEALQRARIKAVEESDTDSQSSANDEAIRNPVAQS